VSVTVADGQVRAAAAFVAAFNEREWGRMRSLLGERCVYEEITKPPRRFEGADQVVAAFQAWARAVPEPRGRVSNAVAGDDQVALEVTWEGSMHGPFGNFAPARRPPMAQGCFVFRFEADRVIELHHYFDSLALFQILGIRP